MSFLQKGISKNRIFSDAEVIKMREDCAKSSMSPYFYAKQLFATEKRATEGGYRNILNGRTYRYLFPGHPYRIHYESQK